MARRSKKAELRKQELARIVPVDQRRMITQPITFAYLNGDMSVMHARIQTTIMDKLQGRIARAVKKQHESGFAGSLFSDEDFAPVKGVSGNYLTFSVKYSELGVDPANYRYVSEAARAMQGSLFYEKEEDGFSSCRFPDGLDRDGALLMESLILGLKQMAEIRDASDNKPYVTLLFEEVQEDAES